MKLVDAKCPNCGAILKVDNSQDAAICEHCGSAFIVEKAIQQFNITNITNNNISAQTVNIISQNKDFVIKAGVLVEYRGESPIIYIPDNVKKIDTYFPDGITEIYMPDSVIEVNPYMLSDVTSIEIIHFSNKIKKLPEKLLKDQNNLREVVLPSNLEEIGLSCFEGCKSLESIELNDGLKKIFSWAFRNSGLNSINLPSSLELITNRAFEGTNITSIDVPSNTQLDLWALANCENLRSVHIGEGIKTLDGTFKGDINLTKVNIPRSVTKILSYAFGGCTNLEKIFIPSSVECLTDCCAKTVYCEIKKPLFRQPKGWSKDWAKYTKKVVWNVTEEEFNNLP